jgi:hypothetical protein
MRLPASAVVESNITYADEDEECPEWIIPQQLLQLHCDATAMAASKCIPMQMICGRDRSFDGAGKGGMQRNAHLGRAVVLSDGSPYLFCSHDCAAIAWTHWCALLSPGEGGGLCSSAESSTQLGAGPLEGFNGCFDALGGAPPIRKLPEEVLHSPYVQVFNPTKISSQIKSLCTAGGVLNTFVADSSGATWKAGRTEAMPLPPWLPKPLAGTAEKMRAFYEHANFTNDVMRVAARAVAMVASVAFMRAAVRGVLELEENPTGHKAAMRVGPSSVQFEDVQAAWEPFQAIRKTLWWDHVPMPSDLRDEADWRCQLKCASPSTGLRWPLHCCAL